MANTPKEMLNFIDSKLKGRTVGYEIAIYQGTALVLSTSGGSAVLGSSPTAMTSKKRTLVGSMSKTITAATVVPLLSALNGSYPKLSVESKISPFLPSSWKRGPNVDQITFRMLLTHTSGLPNAAWDYAGLKALIEAGVPALLPAPPAYSNSGYCLLRVIIPFLSMSAAMKKKVEKDPNVNLPKFLGDQYVDRARAVLKGDGIDVVPNLDQNRYTAAARIDLRAPSPPSARTTQSLPNSSSPPSSVFHGFCGDWITMNWRSVSATLPATSCWMR